MMISAPAVLASRRGSSRKACARNSMIMAMLVPLTAAGVARQRVPLSRDAWGRDESHHLRVPRVNRSLILARARGGPELRGRPANPQENGGLGDPPPQRSRDRDQS